MPFLVPTFRQPYKVRTAILWKQQKASSVLHSTPQTLSIIHLWGQEQQFI